MSWKGYVKSVTQSCRHHPEVQEIHGWRGGILALAAEGIDVKNLPLETKQLLGEGLDPANYVKPMHYCPLLDEYHNKQKLLCAAHECRNCSVFHWAFKDVYWVCCVCLDKGLQTATGQLLETVILEPFYASGLCDVCGEHGILLVPTALEVEK